MDGEAVYVVTLETGAYSNYDKEVRGVYATLAEAQGVRPLDWQGPEWTTWGTPHQQVCRAQERKAADAWNMDPNLWTITEWVVGQSWIPG